MALSDWSTASGSEGGVLHGPTLEVPPVEPAGGDFTYAFNSSDTAGSGAVVLEYDHPSFDFTLGAKISGVLTKTATEGEGCSVFLFCNHGDGTGVGTTVDEGYLLGIQNDGSNRIVLAKGPLANGVPAGEAGSTVSTTKIIARSSNSLAANEWIHLRLQAIVQIGGDVVLVPEYSTVAIGGTPVWQPLPGMQDRYVDGVTEQLDAGPPIIIGRPGFGFEFTATTKGAAVDYIEGARQVS